MKRWLPLCLVFACGPPASREIRLELITRGSCPSSTAAYDLSCVQALAVRLVGGDGTRYRSHCTVLGGRYATLQDLIASPRPPPIASAGAPATPRASASTALPRAPPGCVTSARQPTPAVVISTAGCALNATSTAIAPAACVPKILRPASASAPSLAHRC